MLLEIMWFNFGSWEYTIYDALQSSFQVFVKLVKDYLAHFKLTWVIVCRHIVAEFPLLLHSS